MNEKVKVFISSLCDDDKYRVARNSLKLLLEKTNMVDTYVFELSGGSSRAVVPEYLSKLEDSDLCIFIIDNKDGVSDPVFAEYTRAKELDKKSIYIFCDEKSKSYTKIQEEIKLSSKWDVAHTFADIPEKAYDAVLNDIINIYHDYCKGFIKEVHREEKPDKVNEISIITPVQIQTKKIYFHSFPKLQSEFSDLYLKGWDDIFEKNDTSIPLDPLCADLFLQVICKKEMPPSTLNLLLEESISIYGIEYTELLTARKEALEAYFSGELRLCFEKLKVAYEEAKNNPTIPNWILMDLLVDCRNIYSEIGVSNDKIIFDSEWQQQINDNPETLYYPVLDRFAEEHNESISKFLIQHKTCGPYISRFGSYYSLYIDNAKAFVIASINFSYTQILRTRDRLIDSLTAWCSVYTEHHAFINLTQLLIINRTKEELKKDIYAFGYSQKIESINENDVQKLLDSVKMMPIEYQRNRSKLILFRHFGYYFSDDAYADFSSEIMDLIMKWKTDKNIGDSHLDDDYIIEALIYNARRIDNDWLAVFISDMFLLNRFSWIKKLKELIICLDIRNLSQDSTEKLVSAMSFLSSSDTALERNASQIRYCLMMLRKHAPTCCEIVDKIVEEKFPDYFINDYELEIYTSDNDKALKHMNRYIDVIKYRNENQEKCECYSDYPSDLFAVIANIIRMSNLSFTSEQIHPVVDAIIQTLSITTQSIDVQISAIKLFILIYNRFGKDAFKGKIKVLIDYAKSAIHRYKPGSMFKASVYTLKFYKIIILLTLGLNCYNDFISILASYTGQSDSEIIKSLEVIEVFLDDNNLENHEEKYIILLLQYIMSMSFSDKQDIRFHSTRSLVKLISSQFGEIVREHLSRIMDIGSPPMKRHIVRAILKISDDQKDYKDFILQKARVDNNYFVRKTAVESQP